MKLSIETRLGYQFEHPTGILLQLEAAATPQQVVLASGIAFSLTHHRVRWRRGLEDCLNLPQVPLHELPGKAVQYLLPLRYCPSDQFQTSPMRISAIYRRRAGDRGARLGADPFHLYAGRKHRGDHSARQLRAPAGGVRPIWRSSPLMAQP